MQLLEDDMRFVHYTLEPFPQVVAIPQKPFAIHLDTIIGDFGDIFHLADASLTISDSQFLCSFRLHTQISPQFIPAEALINAIMCPYSTGIDPRSAQESTPLHNPFSPTDYLTLTLHDICGCVVFIPDRLNQNPYNPPPSNYPILESLNKFRDLSPIIRFPHPTKTSFPLQTSSNVYNTPPSDCWSIHKDLALLESTNPPTLLTFSLNQMDIIHRDSLTASQVPSSLSSPLPRTQHLPPVHERAQIFLLLFAEEYPTIKTDSHVDASESTAFFNRLIYPKGPLRPFGPCYRFILPPTADLLSFISLLNSMSIPTMLVKLA